MRVEREGEREGRKEARLPSASDLPMAEAASSLSAGTLEWRASQPSEQRRSDHFCEEKGNGVGGKVDSHRKSIFYISSSFASSSP